MSEVKGESEQVIDTREHVWIVYYRRYSSDEWSAEVFATEARADNFARNKYASDQTAAQVRVKHYIEAATPPPAATQHPFGPCGFKFCDWPDGELRCNEPRGAATEERVAEAAANVAATEAGEQGRDE